MFSRRILRSTALAVMASTLLITAADAQGRGRNKPPEPKGNYVVIQVDDSLSIVRKSLVAWTKGQLARQHARAMKQHREAKRAAKKAKSKFTTPAPKKKTFKVINASSKTDVDARKVMDAYIAKARKKNPKSKLHEGEAVSQGRRGRKRDKNDEGKDGEKGKSKDKKATEGDKPDKNK